MYYIIHAVVTSSSLNDSTRLVNVMVFRIVGIDERDEHCGLLNCGRAVEKAIKIT